jgi:hypothetical protein
MNGTSSIYLSAGPYGLGTPLPNPVTFNYTFIHTNTAARQDINPHIILNLGGGADTVYLSFGGFDGLAVTGMDGAWHVLSALSNDTASDIHVDSTPNIVSPGVGGSLTEVLQYGGVANFLNGSFVELGVWNSDATSQMNTLSSNSHTFWGF